MPMKLSSVLARTFVGLACASVLALTGCEDSSSNDDGTDSFGFIVLDSGSTTVTTGGSVRLTSVTPTAGADLTAATEWSGGGALTVMFLTPTGSRVGERTGGSPLSTTMVVGSSGRHELWMSNSGTGNLTVSWAVSEAL